MLYLISLCLVVFFVSSSSFPTGSLIFQDNFTTTFDTMKWMYQVGHKSFGKNRLMCYQPQNVAVSNGLSITAKVGKVHCDGSDYNFSSGRIKTAQQFNFTSIEVKAKMTNGNGLQPAIWTQQSDAMRDVYEEMDLVEIKGTEVTKLRSAVHWGTQKDLFGKTLKKITKWENKPDLSAEFHTYGLERTDDHLIYYFDYAEYFRVSRTNPQCKNCNGGVTAKHFSEQCHVLISLAVGGNWFSTQVTPQEAQKWSEATLDVAFVNIYE